MAGKKHRFGDALRFRRLTFTYADCCVQQVLKILEANKKGCLKKRQTSFINAENFSYFVQRQILPKTFHLEKK